jgi:hypothetical protein
MKVVISRTALLSKFLVAIGLLVLVALLSQCSDSTAPPPPGSIGIKSGNNQWSLRGAELPDPLEVVVVTADGAAAANVTVSFFPLAGGGQAASPTVQTNDQGVASTRFTLGPGLGTNRVRASIDAGSVVFEAMASNFPCLEAEDTLRVSYGTPGQLFLATSRSSLFSTGAAGIVRVNPFGIPPTASSFVELPTIQFILPLVWDIALSPRGDLYVAGRQFLPELLKIDTGGNVTKFASLEATSGLDAVEITTNPTGLLIGVDMKGPFAVGCRDVLTRFPAASYIDGVSTDALAVDPRRQSADPLGEDVYFILKTDSTLYRLALDSLAVETARGNMGLETVVQLTRDEANGANGMVCDGFDGTVYILVDTPTTKQVVSVTSGGVKTTFFDFFTDPNPPLPNGGVQRDLALRRPRLFTLDTLNDQILVLDMGSGLTAVFSDSLEQIKLSTPMDSGERVSLEVLR